MFAFHDWSQVHCVLHLTGRSQSWQRPVALSHTLNNLEIKHIDMLYIACNLEFVVLLVDFILDNMQFFWLLLCFIAISALEKGQSMGLIFFICEIDQELLICRLPGGNRPRLSKNLLGHDCDMLRAKFMRLANRLFGQAHAWQHQKNHCQDTSVATKKKKSYRTQLPKNKMIIWRHHYGKLVSIKSLYEADWFSRISRERLSTWVHWGLWGHFACANSRWKTYEHHEWTT